MEVFRSLPPHTQPPSCASRAGAMQDRASELLRTSLPCTWVNKSKEKPADGYRAPRNDRQATPARPPTRSLYLRAAKIEECADLCAPSEPKCPATLSYLKQIPVQILEPRGVTPGELKDLGWLEVHSARLQRLERHPAILHLNGINRGTLPGHRTSSKSCPSTPTVRNRGPSGVR